MDIEPFLNQLSQHSIESHNSQKNVLSFSEYLFDFFKSPLQHIRNSNQYARDAFLFLRDKSKNTELADFFSHSEADENTSPVFGQDIVIRDLIGAIDANYREGVPQRLILLHGPNGSGKSSIIQKFMRGLEQYSETIEGALYTFHWVFPSSQTSKQQFGLEGSDQKPSHQLKSFAHLPPESIQSMIRSEIREAPYLLFPQKDRLRVWHEVMTHCRDDQDRQLLTALKPHFLHGQLSPRNQQILDCLLKDSEGNLSQVLKHIQIERFYLNRNKLSGIVTIDPMIQSDMALRQITIEQNFAFLPSSLKSLSLYALEGVVANGNRGIVEYNDLLKRPIESFKYLLTTCETGRLKVGPTAIHLDSIFLGSCNEKQMDAFKEYPDFPSFKARFYLINVPLLLSFRDEAKIYAPLIHRLSAIKPCTPHLDLLIGLWAVLSRLKKPHSQNIPEQFRPEMNRMACLQKAYLYANDWEKLEFTQKNKRALESLKCVLIDQYRHTSNYEGKTGASPREMKNIILSADKRYPESKALTLKAVIEELQELTERKTEYEFLRLDPVDSYHHPQLYIQIIQDIATSMADSAFKQAAALYPAGQIENYLDQYVLQVTHLLRREKIRNPATGEMEKPNEAFIIEFEKRAGAVDPDKFRESVLNSIASNYLNKQEKPELGALFPALIEKLNHSFYEEKRPIMKRILGQILQPSSRDTSPDEMAAVEKTKQHLIETHGYQGECLNEALGWLMKKYQ